MLTNCITTDTLAQYKSVTLTADAMADRHFDQFLGYNPWQR